LRAVFISAPLRATLGYTSFALALPFGVVYPLAGALKGQAGAGGSWSVGNARPSSLTLLLGVDMLAIYRRADGDIASLGSKVCHYARCTNGDRVLLADSGQRASSGLASRFQTMTFTWRDHTSHPQTPS